MSLYKHESTLLSFRQEYLINLVVIVLGMACASCNERAKTDGV